MSIVFYPTKPSSYGSQIQFPHIGASDTTDQYATADDTPTIITWNSLDSSNGFTLASNAATASYPGVYKMTYSLEFANTDNVQHDAVVWLRINTIDVANSATFFSIPARKSSGVYTFVCGYSEVVFTAASGDDIELWWATEKAYSTTGPVDGIYMYAEAAQTTPYAHPLVPSAIGSITFVSAV